jgi:hypothetical protein
MANLLLSYVLLAVGVIAGGWFLVFACRLMTADRLESSKSASRAPGLIDALFGRFRTKEDWIPDARVKGGMIYNKRKKRIQITGRLSDDSFNRVFRSTSAQR